MPRLFGRAWNRKHGTLQYIEPGEVREFNMERGMKKMKSPRIKKIEIKRIQWQIKDCGPGTYSSWMTYNPGVNYRKKLPAYASTMNGGEEGLKGGLSTPESYADFAEQCLEIGYKGFKIHPFPRPNIQDHINLIHAVADRVGGKMDLMLDAFNYYSTFADALKVGRACDEAGFYWIEDPYFVGDGTTENGHQRLKEFLDTPLLQGEKVTGISGKMNMLLSGSTDFIRGNVNGDGITGTKKLASAAETIGADIEIHGVGPAQRHVMSAIGNSNYYEMVWVHPDIECLQLTSDIFLEGYEDGLEAVDADGNVDVPDGPGMGVEWNWDAINKMTVETKIID